MTRVLRRTDGSSVHPSALRGRPWRVPSWCGGRGVLWGARKTKPGPQQLHCSPAADANTQSRTASTPTVAISAGSTSWMVRSWSRSAPSTRTRVGNKRAKSVERSPQTSGSTSRATGARSLPQRRSCRKQRRWRRSGRPAVRGKWKSPTTRTRGGSRRKGDLLKSFWRYCTRSTGTAEGTASSHPEAAGCQ